jgi:hypothetical protein
LSPARAPWFDGRTADETSAGVASATWPSLRDKIDRAISRIDRAAKLVNFESPERRHSAGALHFVHSVVSEQHRCRRAIRLASHAMISERDHALRPLGASGSPILKERGNFPCCSSRRRVEECSRVRVRHSGSRTSSWSIACHLESIQVTSSWLRVAMRRRPGYTFLRHSGPENGHLSSNRLS